MTQLAINLYLDLLKKSLTNTLYAVEPDMNEELEMRFVHRFIEHYIKGPAVSMLPLARFDHLALRMWYPQKYPAD
jgi:hypothetical protein